ncbi:MAG: F0F1 ATP synthase subunit delta [Pseudomonadota bacterium]
MRACDVAADGSATASVQGRYASALYELASEQNELETIEQQLTAFQALIDESDDLRRMIKSPVFSGEDQMKALQAILSKAGITGTTASFFGLIAQNRRLFALPDIIKAFRALAADGRDEITAEVTSAVALTPEQTQTLTETLKASVGKDVILDLKVDPEILGGLIVKLGSRMVDSSLRTKLTNMKVGLTKSAA